jgi:L-fucose mutarotase
LAGATAPEVLRAVLQVLPLDDFGPVAAWSMQVVGDEAAVPPAVAEFQQLLASDGERPAIPIERFEFYRRAEQAAVIFRSGEQRTYGNLLLRKGVVA